MFTCGQAREEPAPPQFPAGRKVDIADRRRRRPAAVGSLVMKMTAVSVCRKSVNSLFEKFRRPMCGGAPLAASSHGLTGGASILRNRSEPRPPCRLPGCPVKPGNDDRGIDPLTIRSFPSPVSIPLFQFAGGDGFGVPKRAFQRWRTMASLRLCGKMRLPIAAM